ncbi:MAG: copper resistance protein B, partial [Planctomycetes bacterium]|nr:copper resistance protein B [Planctomycetota bacterium]
PAADTPAADTPAADTPAGDTPAADTPDGERPWEVDRTGFPDPVHDGQWFSFLRAEQLEFRYRDGHEDTLRWDIQGWAGADYQRLWIKTEGEQTVEGKSEGEFEFQVLFSQVISTFWNLQAGIRYDRFWGPGPDGGRGFGVLGIQGFSPYEFEVDLSAYLSEEADVSIRLVATTDFLITQRLIFQPRFEVEGSLSKVRNLPIDRGFNYIELGARLRYEFMREIAPYVGVNWRRSLGATSGLVRRDGGVVSDFSFVAGITLWF